MKRLTKKEKGFVKDYVATGNGTLAVLNNYDIKSKDPENVAAVMANENLTKPKIQKAIDERLPDDLLEQVHLEGLRANRVISANIVHGEADEGTNDFIEVPDHATRHKFLDSAYKIKGSYAAEKHTNLNINVTPIYGGISKHNSDEENI